MNGRENAPLAQARGSIPFSVVGVVLVMVSVVTLVCSSAAWASTFTVTNANDSGAGSLRAAINAANSLEGADRIVFADGASGTITLASTLPTIRDSAGLTIYGGGDVVVSGNDAVGVFAMSPNAKLSLRNLDVSHGRVDGYGGGVYNDGGTLEVTDSTFSRDRAFNGGAIYNDEGSVLTVSGSTVSDNFADNYGGGVFNAVGAKFTLSDSTFSGNESAHDGGGIGNFGTLEVTASTFSGNYTYEGGAITNEDGTLTVIGSTFSDNHAIGPGGGIYSSGGPSKVVNSTFSGNSSEVGGGVSSSGGPLEVVNSTFSGNSASEGAGGIQASSFSGGTATLRNTIVANSPSGGNCSGPVTEGGYNISDDGTCGFGTANNSLSGVDPLLGPLQDNGGLTKTHALRPASPAINAVPQGTNGCATDIATDQRGVKRPQGGKCEIGSFEDVSPRVIRAVPKQDATGVGPAANVRAFLSEAMRRGSINEGTFQLFGAGTTTPLAARVEYDPTTKMAILDPEANLQSGKRYKAVVGTGAKDLAGNGLDQDRYPTNGEQKKVWFFTIKN